MDPGKGWGRGHDVPQEWPNVFLKQNSQPLSQLQNCCNELSSKVRHLLKSVLRSGTKLLSLGISHSWHVWIPRIQSLIIILGFRLHCFVIEKNLICSIRCRTEGKRRSQTKINTIQESTPMNGISQHWGYCFPWVGFLVQVCTWLICLCKHVFCW